MHGPWAQLYVSQAMTFRVDVDVDGRWSVVGPPL
jgi:hypothetical protein